MQNRKRDTDVQNRLWDSVGEGEGGMFWENSIETCILSRVKQITSPGWMHETSALGWPRGIGWRGRWEGGLGWGTHVTPWLTHVNVWQKPLQYCKVISLQLKKINGKKIKKNHWEIREFIWERRYKNFRTYFSSFLAFRNLQIPYLHAESVPWVISNSQVFSFKRSLGRFLPAGIKSTKSYSTKYHLGFWAYYCIQKALSLRSILE